MRIIGQCYNAVVSVSLGVESTIRLTADLVNSLINTAGYNHGRLADLNEPEIGHRSPDKRILEELTAGYFALAIETQGVLNQLCVLEKQPIPSTFLSRVPNHTRKNIIEMAKRQGVMIDSSVLRAVPFVPINRE